MHARVSRLQMSPDRIDDATRQLNDEQLPEIKRQQGYKGFTVMADRGSGSVMGISYWESEDALKASEDVGDESRRKAAETGQASGEPQVERYEVLLDDMA